MSTALTRTAGKQLGTLFALGAVGQFSDRQLLDRYLARGSGPEADAAFEQLVRRHGPMVRGVCAAALGDAADADDATQATFVVLARHGASIRDRQALASWLYGVACRIARRIRADRARRRVVERRAALERSEIAEPGLRNGDILPELVEELRRLPDRERAPLILCYLEGHSHQQAAESLGCPLRTLQTRLLRGKGRLRGRLLRRGLAPAAILTALDGLGRGVQAASDPGHLDALAAEVLRAPSASALALAEFGIRGGARGPLIRLAGPGVGAVVALLVLFGLVAARDNPERPVAEIKGRVLDPAGKPIAGADVWWPCSMLPESPTAHDRTDGEGRFTLKVPAAWAGTPQHEREWILWAHTPGRRLATASAHDALKGKADAVDLTLGAATDTAFQVLGPDGRPVAGAVVEPHHVKTSMAYIFPPREMLPVLRGLADATGRANLPALDREGLLAVKVTTPTLGSQTTRLVDKGTEPALRPVRLRPAGSLEGRVVSPRAELARGLRVFASTSNPSDPDGLMREQAQGLAEVVTGDDGRFVIPAVAAGRLELYLRQAPGTALLPQIPDNLTVQVGKPTQVEIPLVPGVKVRGVLRQKGNQAPLPGVAIYVTYGSRRGGNVVTDAQGRYEAYVMPGEVRRQIITYPDGLVPENQRPDEPVTVAADAGVVDLPPLAMVRSRSEKGRIVDGGDRPIPGARIAAETAGRLHGYGMSDAGGAFTLDGIPDGLDVTGYKAALPEGGNWVELEVRGKSPLVLRARVATDVPSGEGTRIEGSVTDTGGKPVPGANVTLMIETGRTPGPQGGSFTVTQQRKNLMTDETGRFRTVQSLRKGDRLRALATAPNHTLAGGDWMTAEGATLAFAPLVLIPLRSISGRVLDPDGRPIAGAEVKNWGNPVPLTSALTGPDGLFQLDGVPPGEFRLFVSAPGHRFRGVRFFRGDDFVIMKLPRADQPSKTLRRRGVGLTDAEEAELATRLLAPAAEKALQPAGDAEDRRRVLEALTRLDPGAAWKKCQAGEEPWKDNAVRIAVARSFAIDRPDEARAACSTITSEFWRNWIRFELFDALPPDRVDARLALLDDVKRDAGKIQDPGVRATLQMRVAEKWIDLGRRDEARQLVDEAWSLLPKLDANDNRMNATRSVIGPMARLDLPLGLRLIPTQGDERTLNDLRGLVAQSIAATHPAEAERLIRAMNWNNSETYAVRACRAMAPVDLPRARRLADAIKIDVLRGYAQGRMAEAILATDRAAAVGLLEDAFRTFEQAQESHMSGAGVWSKSAAAPFAAVLLPVIEKVDPDRRSEFIDRILALRWFPRTMIDLTVTTPDTSGVTALQTHAVLAALLFRCDGELAQSIARPILARLRGPLTAAEEQYLDRYRILPMLALVDPRGTAELVEALPEERRGDFGISRDRARVLVAKTLVAPESELMALVRESLTDLEILERGD